MKCKLVHWFQHVAFIFICGVVALSWSIPQGCCQEPSSVDAPSPASTDDSDTNERALHLYEVFQTKAKSLEIAPQSHTKPYQVLETPLLRFTSEGKIFGSVFAWHDDDQRLAVIGTIGVVPMYNVNIEFVELHLLRPQPIEPMRLVGRPSKTWEPDVTEMQLRLLDKAPPVAKTPSLRLTQMRMIVRQFSATMSNEGQTNQLRLLSQPLYRYPDSTITRDGALFAFVWDTGTDPEVLLRIETVETQEGVTKWHYQPIRFTWRDVKLNFDGKEVWHAEEFLERDSSQQTTPYITGLTELVP